MFVPKTQVQVWIFNSGFGWPEWCVDLVVLMIFVSPCGRLNFWFLFRFAPEVEHKSQVWRTTYLLRSCLLISRAEVLFSFVFFISLQLLNPKTSKYWTIKLWKWSIGHVEKFIVIIGFHQNSSSAAKSPSYFWAYHARPATRILRKYLISQVFSPTILATLLTNVVHLAGKLPYGLFATVTSVMKSPAMPSFSKSIIVSMSSISLAVLWV